MITETRTTTPTVRARLLAGALRRLPITFRLGRISMHAARRSGMAAWPDPVRATLRNGVRLPVRLNDYNGRMIYFFGTADPRIVRTCRALLRPGDVFLDIGANLGSIGLQCADRVGPEGRVHEVEPQPALAAGIREAAAGAGFGHLEVHECGLWDEDGDLRLEVPERHTGAAHVLAEGEEGRGRTVTVPVRAAAGFVARTAGDRAFGAKVDIEGAEDRVLPALFAAPGARFVLFETHRRPEPERYWEMAAAGGFTCLGIRPSLVRTRLQPLARPQEMRGWYDVVAVRSDPTVVGTKALTPDALAARLETTS